MTKFILAVFILGFASSAFANGYVCQARNGSLIIKAYNYADGSPDAAVMVLVDPEARAGAKTIARFSDTSGTLTGDDSTFTAVVDLRLKDQHNKETLIAGKVQLQELDTIILKVDADEENGTVELNERSGDQVSVDVACKKYESIQ